MKASTGVGQTTEVGCKLAVDPPVRAARYCRRRIGAVWLDSLGPRCVRSSSCEDDSGWTSEGSGERCHGRCARHPPEGPHAARGPGEPVSGCRSCSNLLPEGALFCPSCGARVDVSEREPVRKLVTILFSDVVGSTTMAEVMDAEALAQVMTAYFSEMSTIIRRHGGVVEKYIGDAVLGVFGFPVVHEDDALRACRAAVEMRAALSRLNERFQATWGVTLQTRTGVNTG
jgi:hypothetical protein